MADGLSRKNRSASGPGHSPARASFSIRRWKVDPRTGEITREGTVRVLEPRVMELLIRLAERPGEVVERADLKRAVWGDPETSEEAVRRAIWELRQALGDDPKTPLYIETIRKGGYRLIAPVERSDPGEAGRRSSRKYLWAFPAAAAVLAALFLLHPSSPPPSVLSGSPLTTFPGSEISPALSPDGGRVAFSWTGGEGENRDIYVKGIGEETPVRLTTDSLPDDYPAWSPDGEWIAFARLGDPQRICVVPAGGGEEDTVFTQRPALVGLDWSPDGRRIAFSAWGEERGMPPRIVLLDLVSGEVSPVTFPSPAFSCDFDPRFSPDGSLLAFVRSGPIFRQDVHVVPVDGAAAPRRLTRSMDRVEGIDWAPDGKSVLFAAKAGSGAELMRVPLAGGSPVRLPITSRRAERPSAALSGGVLAYEEIESVSDIWRIGTGENAEPEPVIRSTALDAAPRYAPSGERFLFLSTRSGSPELWTAGAGGGDPRRITFFEGDRPIDPSWSPDGTRLAVTVARNDSTPLYLIETEDARAKRAGPGGVYMLAGAWSREGNALYYESGDGRDWRIRRLDLANDADEEVVPHDGTVLREEEDGDLLVWRYEEGGIWRVPAAGGPGERVLGAEEISYWSAMQAAPEGIYFSFLTSSGAAVAFREWDGGEARIVARLPAGSRGDFSVSPDRTNILFTRIERSETDLILLRGWE